LSLVRRLTVISVVVALTVAGLPRSGWADSVRRQQWHLRYLNVEAAHQISQGEGVRIGLPDSGVDTTLPDMAGVVVDGTEIGGSGNGIGDGDGHGTAMAGIIAGRGSGPDAGVLGIAPKALILSVQVGASARTLAAGITWAVDHGAKVICVAAGTNESQSLREAIEAAQKADVIVVAGAGNLPAAAKVAFPAKLPGVLAVGGVDHNGRRAEISTTGPEIAIAAPADDIMTTDTFGKYGQYTGTSASAAIVAGAAALVRAKFPKLSAPEVIHRLTATATEAGPQGRDDQYGYGIVDLVKALTADVPPATSAPPPPRSNDGLRTALVTVPLVVAGLSLIAIITIATVVAVRRRRSRVS
jgi:type VII secretion-associated serine protease mycosin